MNEASIEQRLNDYVDGLLSEREASEIERYLASSPEARDTVEFLHSLRERAARLPGSIDPERDLWPEIQRRMAAAPPAPVQSVSPPAARAGVDSWWPALDAFQWAGLATAAVFLVVTSSAITAWLMATPGIGEVPTDVDGGIVPAAVALTELPAIEAEYAVHIERLLWALYENREKLDPDTVSTIETNLRVVDRAIRRAREALEEDPENLGLARMLGNNYRHKLQLLERTHRIIELS